jgi:dethiobiotin synthase
MVKLPERLFVTGTDTAVGKTLVAAMLVAGLDGYYWKPVQSGSDEGTDTAWIQEKTGLPASRFFSEAYRLKGFMSPHAAAARENTTIDVSTIRIPALNAGSHLVMEGAGGVMVPLGGRWLVIDLIKRLAAPVLLVARSTLGTINHTLLSLEKLRVEGIEVAGVVMNGPKNESNRKAIAHFGKVRVLAEVEPMKEINAETLKDSFRKCFASVIEV